jgi:hypothetical protein
MVGCESTPIKGGVVVYAERRRLLNTPRRPVPTSTL